MNDAQFLTTLNAITHDNTLKLPFLSADTTPSSEDVAVWANCLQLCMKQGISISDARWKRVKMKSSTKKFTIFELEETAEQEPDEDFKVGLQLLIGTIDEYEQPND